MLTIRNSATCSDHEQTLGTTLHLWIPGTTFNSYGPHAKAIDHLEEELFKLSAPARRLTPWNQAYYRIIAWVSLLGVQPVIVPRQESHLRIAPDSRLGRSPIIGRAAEQRTDMPDDSRPYQRSAVRETAEAGAQTAKQPASALHARQDAVDAFKKASEGGRRRREDEGRRSTAAETAEKFGQNC